jgi:magnesium-transporting ATPase (P-type)
MTREKNEKSLTTIQETKTMDSSTTMVSNAPHQETKDPKNPAPSRGALSHPGLTGMPHVMTDEQVMEELGSSKEQGLSTSAAEKARAEWGDNIIQPPPKPSVSFRTRFGDFRGVSDLLLLRA